MDKSIEHGPVSLTPNSSSDRTEDMTSAYLSQSLSTGYPAVSISYTASAKSPGDHDAIFGSAGPYDDDGESSTNVERD
jgi:hypothetical protein